MLDTAIGDEKILFTDLSGVFAGMYGGGADCGWPVCDPATEATSLEVAVDDASSACRVCGDGEGEGVADRAFGCLDRDGIGCAQRDRGGNGNRQCCRFASRR